MRNASVIAVALILVAAGLGSGYILGNSARSAETLTSTSTETLMSTITSTTTSTSTATITVASLSTQTFTQTLPAQCLGNPASTGAFAMLYAGTSSPAVVCLQLYEFDSNSSIVLNPATLLTIEGFSPSSGQAIVDPAANFTITASSGSIELGGPTNANEGIVVALSITAKPGASGTYWVQVRQGVLEGAVQGGEVGLYLTGQGGEEGLRFVLVAGTGQPDYVSNVVEMPLYLSCTSSFTIPGEPYNICPDYLYYRIIGMTNSTQ
jgi:hypothetical protein